VKHVVPVLVVVLANFVLAGIAGADGSTAGAPRISSLSGAEETGAAGGDSDGKGFVMIRLNVGQSRVCWQLEWSDIATPFAAHIHVAPAGVAGPIVVPLSISATGSSSGCGTADPELIQAIIDIPENYYVNVHNAGFPGGAIRGQLSVPGQSD